MALLLDQAFVEIIPESTPAVYTLLGELYTLSCQQLCVRGIFYSLLQSTPFHSDLGHTAIVRAGTRLCRITPTKRLTKLFLGCYKNNYSAQKVAGFSQHQFSE